jgi:hypothetical protein
MLQRREVDVETPQVEVRLIVVVAQHETRLTGGRRRLAVQVARQETAMIGIAEAHAGRRRLTCKHLRAIEGAGASRFKLHVGRHLKHVERHVVGVGPDAQLGIVVQQVAERVLVELVRSRRIGGLRDRDALRKGPALEAGERELRQHPAVRQLVVDRDRVAVVCQRAVAAEAREQQVAEDRPRQALAVGLAVDGEGGVDPLHVLRLAHGAVRVRRHARDQMAGGGADAVERHAGQREELGQRRGRLQRDITKTGAPHRATARDREHRVLMLFHERPGLQRG